MCYVQCAVYNVKCAVSNVYCTISEAGVMCKLKPNVEYNFQPGIDDLMKGRIYRLVTVNRSDCKPDKKYQICPIQETVKTVIRPSH